MALISVSDLQQLIEKTIQNQSSLSSETVSLNDALNRVLAQDIQAAIDLPQHNVSAMDGYALHINGDLLAGDVFRVVGESSAGRAFADVCQVGECVRIMTGALVPDSCQTVVMQENVSLENQVITLQKKEQSGSHIRYRGEEIKQGETVLQAGKRLTVADIMLLASLGVAALDVFVRPKVLILSGGDELQEVGETLANGHIYDSNRPMLKAHLQALPVTVIDGGCLKDNPENIRNALQAAASQADVIITSGGVSVGDYDFLKDVLQEIGVIHQYKVAMKPGKPFVFGELGKAWYFGLPGNPISGFVGFDVFVKRALWQLCGVRSIPNALIFQAALAAPVRKSVGRLEMQRAFLSRNHQQEWQVVPVGAQDSHRVLGAAQANAYIILPQECGDLPCGSQVNVQVFDGFF